MDKRKIFMIKEDVKRYDRVFDLGLILKDQASNIIDLANRYRRDVSKRKTFTFSHQMEDEYVFSLIEEKVYGLNLTLKEYIEESIGLSSLGHRVDELSYIGFSREEVKKEKFQNELNAIRIIKLNMDLRDLRAEIDQRQRLIEWLEKKNMDRIKREKSLGKFDEILDSIGKLGKF